MAKTSYNQVSPDQELFYFAGLQQGDSFNFGKIVKKTTLFSRHKKLKLTQKSLLPAIAELWNPLTSAQKLAWTNAGSQCGLNGWRLFVQNQTKRFQYNLTGVGTPSNFYQCMVGNLKIVSPSKSISIVQYHPSSYWVQRKIVGTKSMYEPVKINEFLTLPLQISLNYKSNLTVAGSNPYAKFYAKIWYSYQGIDRYEDLIISIPLVHDWQNLSATLSAVIGQPIAYDLYFTLNDVQGDLYFDNVKAIHGAVNYVRDWRCQNIRQEFSKIWYQIPAHWAPVELPAGSDYGSIFFDSV